MTTITIRGKEYPLQLLKLLNSFIYLFLAVLCLCFCAGFSLVAASGLRSRCGVRSFRSVNKRLLLWSAGSRVCGPPQPQRVDSAGVACGPWSACSVVAHRLSGCTWDFPAPGTELMSPAMVGRFFTTGWPGKPATV